MELVGITKDKDETIQKLRHQAVEDSISLAGKMETSEAFEREAKLKTQHATELQNLREDHARNSKLERDTATSTETELREEKAAIREELKVARRDIANLKNSEQSKQVELKDANAEKTILSESNSQLRSELNAIMIDQARKDGAAEVLKTTTARADTRATETLQQTADGLRKTFNEKIETIAKQLTDATHRGNDLSQKLSIVFKIHGNLPMDKFKSLQDQKIDWKVPVDAFAQGADRWLNRCQGLINHTAVPGLVEVTCCTLWLDDIFNLMSQLRSRSGRPNMVMPILYAILQEASGSLIHDVRLFVVRCAEFFLDTAYANRADMVSIIDQINAWNGDDNGGHVLEAFKGYVLALNSSRKAEVHKSFTEVLDRRVGEGKLKSFNLDGVYMLYRLDDVHFIQVSVNFIGVRPHTDLKCKMVCSGGVHYHMWLDGDRTVARRTGMEAIEVPGIFDTFGDVLVFQV